MMAEVKSKSYLKTKILILVIPHNTKFEPVEYDEAEEFEPKKIEGQ